MVIGTRLENLDRMTTTWDFFSSCNLKGLRMAYMRCILVSDLPAFLKNPFVSSEPKRASVKKIFFLRNSLIIHFSCVMDSPRCLCSDGKLNYQCKAVPQSKKKFKCKKK